MLSSKVSTDVWTESVGEPLCATSAVFRTIAKNCVSATVERSSALNVHVFLYNHHHRSILYLVLLVRKTVQVKAPWACLAQASLEEVVSHPSRLAACYMPPLHPSGDTSHPLEADGNFVH